MIDWTILRNSRYLQYVCVLTAALSIGCSSMSVAWVSASLPKLTASNSSIGININNSQSSWIASTLYLGLIPGGIVGGFLMYQLGRKYTIFIGGLILFLGWLAIAFIKTIDLLLTTRFIMGIGGGILSPVVPIYIGEVADRDVRGRLGTAYNILNISGNVFVLCIGPFVSYTVLPLCCSAVTFVFLVSFLFMPESPYYLVQKDNIGGAREVLSQLLPSNTHENDLQIRLHEIERFVTNDKNMKSSYWEILSIPNYRKSFLIVIGLKLLQQLSGYSPIRSYLQTIIEISGSSISPEISSIVFGVVQLPAVLVAAAVIDKMGRKPLLVISTIGCSVTLIAEGVYFYLDSANLNTDSISWLPTISLCVYLIMLPLGISTIPAVVAGEIFATRVKSVCQTVVSCLVALIGFGTVISFEPVSLAWGIHTLFWIYGGICISGCFLVLIFLPETKGKSFIEIQNKLSN